MEEKKEIIKGMIAKAKEKLEGATVLLERSILDDSVSRAYYAVFHAISAVLFTKGLSFSSHSQTIGKFNKEFIHAGIFPKSYSTEIHFLFDKREAGDYDIDSSIDIRIATRCLSSANEIVSSIEQYLISENLL